MKKNMGVILDPFSTLNTKKDSTLAMMEAAQKRNWNVFAMTMEDLFVESAQPWAIAEEVHVDRKKDPFVTVHAREKKNLNTFDIILMRKDPPYNVEYVYVTSLLDLVDNKKTLISNRPSSLRSFNEKFLINYASKWMPPTLFTRNREQMDEFIKRHGKVVVKPMDLMGGQGVFVIDHHDKNRSVILETLTKDFSKTVVVQKYLPEITNGDRRIFVIGGKALPQVMVRKPSKTDHRGNLAAGASADFGKITEQEQKMVSELKPFFIQHGLHLVGLDLIGPYITEINITSPTGLVQVGHHFDISIEDMYLDYLETLCRGL